MFSNSTQIKHWMFENEEELINLRYEANLKYIEEHKNEYSQSDETPYEYFLSPSEERALLSQYENVLRDFCRKFQPPMPRTVMGTAFQFYKRFYLNNSVMDNHPKHMVVTCVYLACKVEEFNVSMIQFVANVKGDRAKAADIVLNNELLLMHQLKYHLTIHNPFRPIEGFLIDIKTRCPEVDDPERFRSHIDYFIDNACSTDAFLLFSPSQIGLAAIVYAASKCGANLDKYLTDILFADAPEKLESIRNMMKSLWTMIRSIEQIPKERIKIIEKKLERCRNQANNPDSLEYKRALKEAIEAEEAEPMIKYARLSEEQRRQDDAYLHATSGLSKLSTK